MKCISLTKGQVALVDDEDFLLLSQWNWYAYKGRENTSYYAARGRRQSDATIPRMIRMHRVIMNTPEGMECDHRDGNGLNNQKGNLRNCSISENHMNQRLDHDSSTGYKGVSRHRNNYQVQIKKNRKNYRLGTFKTPELAAKAYNNKAIELFGEFAKLNILKE